MSALRWVRTNLVLILGLLVLAYTFVPIAIVILMSFNEPDSRLIYKFDGFTLDNWLNPCADPGMCEAVARSIEIGLLTTVVATILGTLMAFALVRYEFSGRSSTPSSLPPGSVVRSGSGRSSSRTSCSASRSSWSPCAPGSRA